ncbi:hypothetical protein G6F59_013783 [Rhizopus arrhizus]|nr:hypothetical protein G6F59_013783 [Rhizopus arrhizus]
MDAGGFEYEAEAGVSQHRRQYWRTPAQRTGQAERQQHAEHPRAAVQQQGVGERQWCGEDALAAGLDRRHRVQALLQLGVEDRVEVTGAQGLGQFGGDHRQQRVRHVLTLAELFTLALVQPRQGHQGPDAPAQAPGQGMGEGRGDIGDAAATAMVIGQQQIDLAGQRTRFKDQLAPQLAAFPPAVIAGAVAEAEEDRQHQAEQVPPPRPRQWTEPGWPALWGRSL